MAAIPRTPTFGWERLGSGRLQTVISKIPKTVLQYGQCCHDEMAAAKGPHAGLPSYAEFLREGPRELALPLPKSAPPHLPLGWPYTA